MAEMCRSANLAIGKALKAHPDRFIGSAVLPTQNIKATLEEAERAYDAGFPTFFMKSWPGRQELRRPVLLAALGFRNEHNVPISVHANTRDWGTVCDPKRIGDGWGFFVARSPTTSPSPAA